VWHPTVTQSACNTAFHRANVYAEAITRTGGTWGSICDADYSSTLSAISYDLSMILRTQFALQYEPYATTLQVFVNNQLQSSGFKLTGNVLEFTSAPAAGASIRVEYEFTHEPPRHEFYLAHVVDGSTLQVFLDGAATTAFTYDAGARSIRFADAPMAHEIKAVYRKDGELKSEFQIGKSVNASTIRVAVDGKSDDGFSYTASTGVVRLSSAPKDAAAVRISFDQMLSPKLRYPVYATQEVRNQLRVYDANTTRALPVSIDGDDIVFQPRDYKALRDILVIYPAVGTDALKVDLGRSVLADSITVKGFKSGLCDGSFFTVSGSVVDMRHCKFQANEGIEIQFTYAAEHKSSFDLGSLNLDLAQYRWKVAVNGVDTESYTISDKQLSLPDLPLNARVDVSLYKTTR
jgi:hypothetical protein